MSSLPKSVCTLLGLTFLLLDSRQELHAQAPLYNNIPPEKQLPSSYSADAIRLASAPSATNVTAANQRFSARAAAAIYQAAQPAFPQGSVFAPADSGQPYAVALLARWAYRDYFDDDSANSKRLDTLLSLQLEQAGKTGTDGDYDFMLHFYIPLLYKYYNDIPGQLRDHIINDLLNERSRIDVKELIVGGIAPETENHKFGIEAARYLSNQLLFQRYRFTQFDNNRNNDSDTGAPVTTEYILEALQTVLKQDFLEYNARPYQDITMSPLLNLATYAYDNRVRLAARMVLDYVSAKIAVSSNDLRRAPPFRRRAEAHFLGPGSSDGSGALGSPLVFKVLTPDKKNIVYDHDPQIAYFTMLAGNTDMFFPDKAQPNQNLTAWMDIPPDYMWGDAPPDYAWEMVHAAVCDYRIPDPILDLFVSGRHRRFYQKLHHAAGAGEYAEELYAGSPSYLISAGGRPTGFCYPITLPGYPPFGSQSDLGLAMPTFLMPTGSGTSLDSMVQFGRIAYYPSVLLHVFGQDFSVAAPLDVRNMGVAPDFACGNPIYLPDSFDPDKHPTDPKIKTRGNWTFIDRGSDGSKAGYFLAIYRVDNGSGGKCGFLEAYDTWLHPGEFSPLTFAEFQAAVTTPSGFVLQFGSDQVNRYVTYSGQVIQFTISPHSDIISTTESSGYTDQFAHGTIINSEQSSGVVTISNPALGTTITLDMSKALEPRRVSESSSGILVEDTGVPHELWVDFTNGAAAAAGDFGDPFNTLTIAVEHVAAGGTINIVPGAKREPITITKKMTLRSFPGSATLGRQ